MPNQQIDPDQQKAILDALTQKYQDASDTSGVDQAIQGKNTADLISGIGQALDTAAHAQTVSRGGQKADPTVFNMIAQQGQQGVQDARAQRQMAVDQAMKNIELNNQGLNQSMAIGGYNLGQQKGAKDLIEADIRAKKGNQDLAMGNQQLQAGKYSLKNTGDNNDVTSNVSQLKQQLASQLVPGKDFSKFTGAQLDATIPELKDMYDKQTAIQIEKIKSNPAIAGNKASDEAFAKDYVDYVANGGAASVKQNLSKVQEVSDALGKPGNKLSGSLIDAMANIIGLKEYTNPDSVALEQKLRASVLPMLKSIFPRLTEVEVNEALSTAYNPKLSPELNKQNVDKFLERLKSEADSKQAAAQYFQENKTLNRFKGRIPGSAELSGLQDSSPASESKASSGIDTGFGHLSDQDLQDRINKLKASK